MPSMARSRNGYSRDATGYTAASLYAELDETPHAVSLAEPQGSVGIAGYIRLFPRDRLQEVRRRQHGW